MFTTMVLMAAGMALAGDARTSSEDCFRKAVAAERALDAQRRQDFLQKAVDADDQFAAARWALGYVNAHGTWISVSEFSIQTNRGEGFRKYLAHRRTLRPDAAGEVALAKWCEEHQLPLQHAAHLRTAVYLDRNNEAAHRALGRVCYEGEWLTPAERDARKEGQKEVVRARRHWERELRRIVRDLREPGTARFEKAAEELSEIEDPLAVPVLMDALASHSEAVAGALTAVLGKIIHAASTEALIRLAVWSQWQSTRDAAVETLRSRDPEHTIPLLIEFLRPVDSEVAWVPNVGRVWFFQDYATNYVDITPFNAPSTNGSERMPPKGRNRDSQRNGRTTVEAFANAQADNEKRFENTAAALEKLTGEKLGTDIHRWRKWWADGNLQYYSIARVATSLRTDEVTVQKPITEVGVGTSLGPSISDAAAKLLPPVVARPRQIPAYLAMWLPSTSCFAAGTPVWTIAGPVAIDQLRVGDLVLSLDPETGELAYKPVLRRELRVRSEMVSCDFDSETIRMTRKHPVWAAGQSWVHAEELTDGTLVRTISDLTPVEKITDAEAAEACNLEIADFCTYFVGKKGILVHDVTPIRELPRDVPGLAKY